MKLTLTPACITSAEATPGTGASACDILLKFYSNSETASALVINCMSDKGELLDSMVLSVRAKDGKLRASRKLQPIKLGIDQ